MSVDGEMRWGGGKGCGVGGMGGGGGRGRKGWWVGTGMGKGSQVTQTVRKLLTGSDRCMSRLKDCKLRQSNRPTDTLTQQRHNQQGRGGTRPSVVTGFYCYWITILGSPLPLTNWEWQEKVGMQCVYVSLSVAISPSIYIFVCQVWLSLFLLFFFFLFFDSISKLSMCLVIVIMGGETGSEGRLCTL